MDCAKLCVRIVRVVNQTLSLWYTFLLYPFIIPSSLPEYFIQYCAKVLPYHYICWFSSEIMTIYVY